MTCRTTAYTIRGGSAYNPAHGPGYKPVYEPSRRTPPCSAPSCVRQAVQRKPEDVKPPVPRRCPMVWGQGTAKPLGNPCVNIC
jgi:hypothetical protein